MFGQSMASGKYRTPFPVGGHVMITSGRRCLGRVMAQALVEHGASVMINGARASAELTARAAELDTIGGGHRISMEADAVIPT